MKALLAYVRPHRRTLYVGIFLALLGAAGGLAQPLAASYRRIGGMAARRAARQKAVEILGQ